MGCRRVERKSRERWLAIDAVILKELLVIGGISCVCGNISDANFTRMSRTKVLEWHFAAIVRACGCAYVYTLFPAVIF